jgi:hypothetical protein
MRDRQADKREDFKVSVEIDRKRPKIKLLGEIGAAAWTKQY